MNQTAKKILLAEDDSFTQYMMGEIFSTLGYDYDIAKDGTISTNTGEKAKLGLATFANEQSLKRRGTSLYETDQAPREVEELTDVTVLQKAYESSNVNAIEAMVEMIDVSRAYQTASTQSKDYEDMREDALRRLGRVQ